MFRILASILLFIVIQTPITHAQITQIPTLQVCNNTKVHLVEVLMVTDSRGKFGVSTGGDVRCEANHPEGELFFYNITLGDSEIEEFNSLSIEQLSGLGRKYQEEGSYTAFLSGRCFASYKDGSGDVKGCKYWMLINDATRKNGKDAPRTDVLSFVVFNYEGKVISYGTGVKEQGEYAVHYTK